MDHRLLEIIACPVCNGKLWFNQEKQELTCKLDNLAFPLRFTGNRSPRSDC